MPSTSFDTSNRGMQLLQFWLYRIGAYLLINVIDDPAWLALMFC